MATTYSDEFKEKMVHLYNAGKTITELSRDYGVSKSALSKWIKFFNSSGSFREADNHGRINKQIYGNGTSTTYSYDQWLSGAGRLMTLNTKKRNDEVLQELSYSYDPIGNITQLNNMGETLTFSYDALSRLTGVSGAYEESYEYYPATGNLKSKTGIEGDYHYGRAGAHAVTGYGTQKNVFEYDANGQMVKRHGAEITYDAQGKLTSYLGKSYVYDGDGNRVMMDHGEGSVTIYIGNYYEKHISRVDSIGPVNPPVLFGESFPIYFPVVGNGEPVDFETHRGQTYYYAGSSRIATRTEMGEVIWLYGDHLGSTSVTADRYGNELSRTKYHAWGSTWSGTGDAQTNYAYTGQMKVDDIYYYNARWYDPVIGRFMQADTIVPSYQGTQGFDRYAYVNNNPMNHTDPRGSYACGFGGFLNYDCPGPDQNPDSSVAFNFMPPLDYSSRYVIPKAVSNWSEIKNDPIDLITRAALSEEGGKVFTYAKSDLLVAIWGIRNRHDLWYETLKEHPYGTTPESDRWLRAATEGIYGMVDPTNPNILGYSIDIIGNYRQFGNTEEEAVLAYNLVRDEVIRVLLTTRVSDRYENPLHYQTMWADAGFGIQFERTHFWFNDVGYSVFWCMPDAIICEGK